MSTQGPESRSTRYEFTDEQNKTISHLADGMGAVGTLLKMLGLTFVIFLGLQVYQATRGGADYGTVAGLGVGTLICLAIGFWTGGSAHSFRRIVETKNEDIWHLMNALEGLRNMYGLLRSLIVLCLVLVFAGFALTGYAIMTRPG